MIAIHSKDQLEKLTQIMEKPIAYNKNIIVNKKGKLQVMKLQIYKSIMLPSKLQEKIKLLATKQNKSTISFIEELLKSKSIK